MTNTPGSPASRPRIDHGHKAAVASRWSNHAALQRGQRTQCKIKGTPEAKQTRARRASTTATRPSAHRALMSGRRSITGDDCNGMAHHPGRHAAPVSAMWTTARIDPVRSWLRTEAVPGRSPVSHRIGTRQNHESRATRIDHGHKAVVASRSPARRTTRKRHHTRRCLCWLGSGSAGGRVPRLPDPLVHKVKGALVLAVLAELKLLQRTNPDGKRGLVAKESV